MNEMIKHGNIAVPGTKHEQALIVSDARERHADRQQESNILTQTEREGEGQEDW